MAEPVILAIEGTAARAELGIDGGGVLDALVLDASDGPTPRPVRVVEGRTDVEAPAGADTEYRGAHLYPFPNRLAGGVYRFGGRTYRFSIDEPARNTSLHGFLHAERPIVERRGEDRVRLRFDDDGGRQGFPFAAQVCVEYHLVDPRTLRFDVSIRNLGSGAMPFGFGWHPYLTIDDAVVDELNLRLAPGAEVAVDERMLPTGERTTSTGFETPCRVDGATFDTCFALAPAGAGAPLDAVTLWSPRHRVGVTMSQDEAFGFVQLYTPADRRSIAVEPMTCAIDALNSGDGLRVLPPGEVFGAAVRIELQVGPPEYVVAGGYS